MHSNPEAGGQTLPSGLSVEDPKYYFNDFVEMQVKSQTNDFSIGFELSIAVTIGEYSLTVLLSEEQKSKILRLFSAKRSESFKKDHVFRIRLLHCSLRYQLAGCDIPITTKYRYCVQAGVFRTEVQERFRTATKLRAGGSIDASTKLTTIGGSAKFEGKAHADASTGTDDTDVTTATIRPEIAVVEHAPNGWTIGHPSLGDPFHATSEYCLSGSYFLQKVKGYDHSCRVEFRPETHTANLSFMLTVRDGFYVERVGADLLKPADEDEKLRVIEEMRAKIAGLALEKELKASDAFAKDRHELLLASLVAQAGCDRPTVSREQSSGAPAKKAGVTKRRSK